MVSAFAVFNDRPIFSEQRKPIVPTPVGTAAAAPQKVKPTTIKAKA